MRTVLNASVFGISAWATLLAFIWLLAETKFLTVRLPCGKAENHDNLIQSIFTQIDAMPKFQKTTYSNPCANLLPQYCGLTEQLDHYQKQDSRGYHYFEKRGKNSYQQLVINNFILTILATSPKLYELIDDCRKAQDVKPHDGFAQAPCNQIPMFITQERTGCEKVQHGMRGGRRYYKYDDTYKTVYHDCLVSADWLKEHEYDLDGYTPEIDITINGQTCNVNGNYKKGMITAFMLQHSKRIRVGRKMQTVFEDAQIVDMGDGLKVVTYPEPAYVPDALDKAIDQIAQKQDDDELAKETTEIKS